eukprot:UN34037
MKTVDSDDLDDAPPIPDKKKENTENTDIEQAGFETQSDVSKTQSDVSLTVPLPSKMVYCDSDVVDEIPHYQDSLVMRDKSGRIRAVEPMSSTNVSSIPQYQEVGSENKGQIDTDKGTDMLDVLPSLPSPSNEDDIVEENDENEAKPVWGPGESFMAIVPRDSEENRTEGGRRGTIKIEARSKGKNIQSEDDLLFNKSVDDIIDQEEQRDEDEYESEDDYEVQPDEGEKGNVESDKKESDENTEINGR